VSEAPRILVASAFADPEPIGANRTVAALTGALRDLGRTVDVLTIHCDRHWRGEVPRPGGPLLAGLPYVRTERGGITYHVVTPPWRWLERWAEERDWQEAVEWGSRALAVLRPSLVHLHFWQFLRWMLDAAQWNGIPTVYSAHDYGAACCQTVLVTGRGSLCDGRAGPWKCSLCVVTGRNLLGLVNELAVQLPPARLLVDRLGFGPDGTGFVRRAGGVRTPVQRRVGFALRRSAREFGGLRALVVTTSFAKSFFAQFGVPAAGLRVLPWFSAYDGPAPPLPPLDGGTVLGFLGRMESDKGLHVLLQALEQVPAATPLVLRIGGTVEGSAYAEKLRERYRGRAGPHRVEWCGWLDRERIPAFYAGVHVVVVPSLWHDNCPLALVEALAHGRPVVCTDVPTMTELVRPGINGEAFPIGDTAALADVLGRLAASPERIGAYGRRTGGVPSLRSYAGAMDALYAEILGEPAAPGPRGANGGA
jgi:glycosyltransferase involved in cell wall biosynthesis